jgi:hypothetical protein
MMGEGKVIEVELPILDQDAAEKLVDSGKIIYSLLNYLALNPQLALEMYPNQEKFAQLAEKDGVSIAEIKQDFIRNHRAALIAIAYCGKVVLNQVAEQFEINHTFDLTADNMLMEQFTKDYSNQPDDFDIEAAMREVSNIMKNGGLN